jgi:superoxide reductase
MTEKQADLFEGINTPKDHNNMTDLEKKHVPVITAPAMVNRGKPFNVTIEVGKLISHPNEHDHHIEFVDLYEDKVFLCRADLSAARTFPNVTFNIALQKGGILRAFESCNMHGVWEGTTSISVE